MRPLNPNPSPSPRRRSDPGPRPGEAAGGPPSPAPEAHLKRSNSVPDFQAPQPRLPKDPPQLPMPIAVPTENNPQGLRPPEHGRRRSLDQANPEMQAYLNDALNRPMPDPKSTDPVAKMVWRAHVEKMARILERQNKALEPRRPTAQDLHFMMKRGGPDQAPELLLEILHALPEPHREFMHGNAGVDILPDAKPSARPKLGLDWNFPRMAPARPATPDLSALDPEEFGHVRRFQGLHDPAPPPAAMPPPAPPETAHGTGDSGIIIIPDL